MADEIDTQDATFFTGLDPAALLAVEIRKTEARLKSLKIMQAVAGAYQQTLHEPSIRAMVERAYRLGQRVNNAADSAFVKEVETLNFDQLCFLAKGYDASRIGLRLRADCLQVFMSTHGATVDKAARSFVATGAKRAGGRFHKIFEGAQEKHEAQQRCEDRIAAARDMSDLCRAASLTKATSEMLPLATMLIHKAAASALFHDDFIALMMRDKSWGDQTAIYCCNGKEHIYRNATEWRIDVPRGIDPRTMRIFREQGGRELVQYDTVDVVVVKCEGNSLGHNITTNI